MIWDNTDWAASIIKHFKEVYPEHSNKNIIIETFSSYDDYHYALTASLTAGKTPDIFMLNNNEDNSVFSNQVIWVDSKKISPNDFRKKFKWFFSDDLIIESGELEFLEGVPVWYESLWIFYNRRFVQNSELKSMSWLNNVVAELKDKNKTIVPIGIWNGSTVIDAWDIVTQFFMLENDVDDISDVVGTKLVNWLASYFLYGDSNWYNGYDTKYMELTNLWQTSVDLFSRWETFMVIWYPSLINTIAKKWFSKNFLLATPFPHYHSWEWSTLVNYDYFVINKDSIYQNLANDFLAYIASDLWAENFLEQYKYFLPALLSLESDKLEEKIHPNFNIILNDFYNSEYELSSFNKWVKNIYDRNIIPILDNAANYESTFTKFRQNILCKAKKIETLTGLSSNCEE